MERWLADSLWSGVLLWVILYTSDYYLTVYTARGFREIGHFRFEGSFELTPQFQNDIDALRPLSKRHIIFLLLSSLVIAFFWWAFNRLFILPWAYLISLGMLILLEAAVHARHLRNMFIIREVRTHGGVEGEIKYRRVFTYKASAFDLFIFSGIFSLTALLTFSPLFLGGALMCLTVGIRHSILWNKAGTDTSTQAANGTT